MSFQTLLLQTKELIVDNVYLGGRMGNASDDPLHSLTGTGNQGGFRFTGSVHQPNLIVLSSSQKISIGPIISIKKLASIPIMATISNQERNCMIQGRSGNLLLRNIFEMTHISPQKRKLVPPILVFANAGSYRDVVFLGLAVPGVQGVGFNK